MEWVDTANQYQSPPAKELSSRHAHDAQTMTKDLSLFNQPQ